jgi:type I restriction enzyme S subunit
MFGDPVLNPKKWTSVKLGDLIFSASDGPHVSPSYVEIGIPFLSTRHVRPGEVIWKDLKYISADDAKLHWKKCKPIFGDILYSKGGTTGYAAVVRTKQEFAIWVHIALLKPNFEKCNSVWLEHMLNSQYCYRQSQELTHGIANRDLGLKRMVNILMYQPPLALQEQFATRINHIAALTQQTQLFASLQHQAFTGNL